MKKVYIKENMTISHFFNSVSSFEGGEGWWTSSM